MQKVNTASSQKSIWKSVGHEDFGCTISKLQAATNQVPIAAHSYGKADWLQRGNTDTGQIMSFEEELYLADSLAFLAASQDHRDAVSAVAIEQHKESRSLTVVLAANRRIPKDVCPTFQRIFRCMQRSARGGKSTTFRVE